METAEREAQRAGEQPLGLPAAARVLREVVTLIDAGELDATPAERAHLVGAADAVSRLVERG